MTVKEKIELLKAGVKMSDIKDLEKEEALENNPTPEPEPTPKPEPQPKKEPAPEPQPNPEQDLLKKELEEMKLKNAELEKQIQEQNARFASIKDDPEPDYGAEDVLKELFHKSTKKEV